MDFKEKRTLGRTGLSVSRLGLAGGYGVPAAAIERAYHEYGINYFYWGSRRTEKMGDALRHLVKDHREDMVIVLQSYDHLGWTVKKSVEKGLNALGVECADVVLLGWHNRYPQKILSEALKLKERGLVRFIAMSGHKRKTFGAIAQKNDSDIDVFMIRYNAAHTGAEEDIFPHLPADNRPGITIYTATRWGKLLKQKKMPPGEKPLTASDCYRFVLSHPNVDLCIMGPKTEEQMLGGLETLEKGPLSEAEMERVRKIGDYVHG